ncbi:FUSC family protein [Streptomyces sp. NPDC021093]|uniref:FUSC family protein n=1 Tax=Streptomyces sp. NPDC021093 TaxID=3365112 RepID=UPI003796A650
MGALSAVIGDTADAYRMRLFNIAVPQLFGAVGVTLGALVFGHGWVAVGVLTALALISGMISSIGAVASVCGLLLLLNATVGAGLPMPGPWWLAPALLTLGGLLVLLLTLLGWPWRGGVPERVAVSSVYREVAALLEAAGTPDYADRRQAVSASLNHSYDLILARRTREHGRRGTLVRSLAQLNALIPLLEAAPAVHFQGGALPAEIPATVRNLADAIEHGAPHTARPPLCPRPATPAARALDEALHHAAQVARDEDPDPYNIDDRLGRPASLRVRVRRTTRNVLRSGTSWRYGLRLATCIGLAQCLVSLIDVPRSYWVTLTIVFVMKPDFGSVFSRAVLRAVGTAAGLVVAAAVLSQIPRGWWDVPVMAVLAALIPFLSQRGYAYQTAAITPVILLLSDLLNRQGFGLIAPRLLDSLIGCGIALVAGYLLWPESWGTRVGDRLAKAVSDTADHVALAFPADARSAADTVARAHSRRRLYRDLMSVRTEFQRALTEPPPMGRRAAAWWPLVIAVERIVDATTAAHVRVEHGAPPPAPSDVAAIAGQLRALSEGLRGSTTLVSVRADLPGAASDGAGPDDVLAPLRQEVLAARAIASPRR